MEKPKRCRRPKEEKAEQTGPGEKQPDKAPRKGRTPKAEKEAPEQGKPKKAKAERAPKDKAATTGAPAVAETAAPEVSAPRDATRAGEEKVVYIDLTELFPFKDHPFGVRNDTEMQSLVESVKTGGVNQPVLVRPREGGGYEIILKRFADFSIYGFHGTMIKKRLWQKGGGLMISIGVCDDEAYMLDILTEKISAFFKQENMEITIFRFQNGEALLDYDKKFDIVFLDIQMGDPDGLETAKELRSRGYNGFLIFITVLQEYVFHAFEVQAFDYLVKPLQEDNFSRTMSRLLLSIRSHKGKQLLIQKGTEWSIVPFDDIVYCEIINRKVYLHLKDEPVLDYYDKIETLERKLDERFFKCHRSYLINLQYLKSYKAGQAYLTNGETIPVSRLRGDEFSTVILQYIKERGHRNG